jgi:KUP system potassium uptake protein
MQERNARHPGGIAALGFAALGVVFGDIGTSPLYTLKTVLDLTGDGSPATVLGVLSLIVWTLIAITSIKYVTIAMRVDNDGEGGILALMALLGVKRQRRPAIVALGLFGAALIYGDGAITPAISVLSALEGLTIAAPGLGPYVVPMAVAILIHCAVRHSVAGNRAHWSRLRPGDGGLVSPAVNCTLPGIGGSDYGISI